MFAPPVLECPDHAAIGNGTYDPSVGPYVQDTTLTYACDPGYYLSGDAQNYCDLGIWTGSVPSCSGEHFCLILSASMNLRHKFVCSISNHNVR